MLHLMPGLHHAFHEIWRLFYLHRNGIKMAFTPGKQTISVTINGKPHHFKLVKVLDSEKKVKLIEEIVDGQLLDGEPVRDRMKLVMKDVEIKLSTDAAARATTLRTLRESWKRMCRVQHCNVLQCISATLSEPGSQEIVMSGTQIMEYSDMGDLKQHMQHQRKTTPITMDQVKNYSYQILQGIEYLHSAFNLVHGDLKPQNIIVFPDPSRPYGTVLKIIDLDDHAALDYSRTKTLQTGAKVVSGTLCYMSPELLQIGSGGKNKVGRLTDIWSFGCIILVLLSGEQQLKFAYCADRIFTDPLDPALQCTAFQTVVDPEDFRRRGGMTMPLLPGSLTDKNCRDFLKQCLASDPQKRSRTAILHTHSWLIHEHERSLTARGLTHTSKFFLHREPSWPGTVVDCPPKEKHWVRGLHNGGTILTHSLRALCQYPVYEDARQTLLAELRSQPFSEKQKEMCVNHLAAVITTLKPIEQETATQIKEFFAKNKEGCATIRPLFPVYLSLPVLCDFLNNFSAGQYGALIDPSSVTQYAYSVKSNLEWKDIESALDKKHPVICQIAQNEIDQDSTLVTGARMLSLGHLCPHKLIELDFVILTGYSKTMSGDTYASYTKAEGDTMEMNVKDFEAIWNWRASDSLLQQYLTLEDVRPASALFRSVI
ncbi:uncharacterized protein LOC129595752 [Paramacrobiotus metropolitanus]|uniref:uncharacterized protein LOC129595752 n=1 Tax=Paramacrobiotus metropolitanus TaxID=2943436 RepID=UPI0024464852|nr:uncharacterized protein LOC129595752 [Paramacrobiotus metropolitanus]